MHVKNPIFLIVTGLSGSGKSTAMKSIEDEGFFCMDNIPMEILAKFVEIYDFATLNLSKVCIGIDVRAGASTFAEKAPAALKIIKDTFKDVKFIYLDAKSDTILNRFKETRRRHPLSETYPNLTDAIKAEEAMLAPIRELCGYVIDTSAMNVHELSARMKEIISSVDKSRDMYIEVRSFGFKKGIPIDADYVMDVRFLPNPHFVEDLMHKTGMDPEVKEYLAGHENYLEFLKRFKDLVSFILPLCKKEGRSYLNIAVGCTGGRHRSVAIAEEIKALIEQSGFNCKVIHRDLS